ncbi:MAG TPA: Hpt domain-containing protein [Thermoanaerobaculia bacterium]|nr:Hpt domain-containing protein [Thermoanaerobaculia bacterium]
MERPIDPAVLAGFLDEVRGYLPRIASDLAACERPNPGPNALETAHRLAHTIRGASAMVGLAPLSHMASYAERALEEVRGGRCAFEAPLAELLAATVGRIGAYLDGLGAGPEDGSGAVDLLAVTVADFRRWRGLPAEGDPAELAELAGASAAAPEALRPWPEAAGPLPPFPLLPRIAPDDPAGPAAAHRIAPDLVETFLEEAEVHLQSISAALRALSAEAGDSGALEEMRRSVHTLKGAAGLVGFDDLAGLAHRMEDLLDRLAGGGALPSAADLGLLFDTADALEDLLGQGVLGGELPDLAALYGRYDGQVPARAGEPAAGAAPARAPRHAPARAPGQPASVPPAGPVARVPLERLDRVVRLASELVVHRAVFERHVAELSRRVEELAASHERLRRVAHRFEADREVRSLAGAPALAGVAAGGLASPEAAGFDPLELDRYTELDLLARELQETSSDLSTVSGELAGSLGDLDADSTRLGRLTSDVQSRLMSLRMVPLGRLASRLHRAVRVTAEREGKEVDLEIEGEAVELDKTVLEGLADPLLHLLRNAVSHGIEPEERRRAANKPERGRIRVQAAYEGVQLAVRVSDDGAGLDPRALRAAAVAAGRLDAEAAAGTSDERAHELAFLPGLSTASALSEVSGRGVGLDVVRTAVHRLGGSVAVRSAAGRGTTFELVLPLTLAVARVLLVEAHGETFAVPLRAVVQILRVERSAIERPDGEPVLALEDRVYPLVRLGRRLRLARPADESSPQVPILILALGHRRAALAVDRLGQAREVVVKPLGPLLRHVPGIWGATLTGDGEVVLIVDPAALTGEETSVADAVEEPPRAGAAAARALEVMVVDDSLSVRRVLARLLESAAWRPVLARDGLEALELLQQAERPPDAILLDIEMPRMDGYELTATLRGLPAFAAVPIVILTSRAGEKHRRRAFELGATEYLVKPYEDAALLGVVRRVAREARPA